MKKFWTDTAERAVRTLAQTALATIGSATILGAVDWVHVASTAGLAAVLSLLTAVATRGITGKNSASLIDETDGKDE